MQSGWLLCDVLFLICCFDSFRCENIAASFTFQVNLIVTTNFFFSKTTIFLQIYLRVSARMCLHVIFTSPVAYLGQLSALTSADASIKAKKVDWMWRTNPLDSCPWSHYKRTRCHKHKCTSLLHTADFPVAAVRAGADVWELSPVCAGPSMILRPRCEQTPCAWAPSASAENQNERTQREGQTRCVWDTGEGQKREKRMQQITFRKLCAFQTAHINQQLFQMFSKAHVQLTQFSLEEGIFPVTPSLRANTAQLVNRRLQTLLGWVT